MQINEKSVSGVATLVLEIVECKLDSENTSDKFQTN